MFAIWLATPAQALAKEFPDVPEGHWARTYVSVVSDVGVMTGYSGSGLFGAEDGITRGQVATMLFRIDNPGSDATTTGASTQKNQAGFSDVADGQYYTAAMNWAKERGVFTGDTGRNTVRPNDGISRQDLAIVLYRFSGEEWTVGDGGGSNSYAYARDAHTVAEWAATGMDWCFAKGILRGNAETGCLMPNDGTTRTQASKMFTMAIGDLKAKLQSACDHKWVDITEEVEVVDREAYDAIEPETITSAPYFFNNGRCIVCVGMPKVLFVGKTARNDGTYRTDVDALHVNLDECDLDRWVLDDRIYNAWMEVNGYSEKRAWRVWYEICRGDGLFAGSLHPDQDLDTISAQIYIQNLVDRAGLTEEEARAFAEKVLWLMQTSQTIGNYSDTASDAPSLWATASTGEMISVHHDAETHYEREVVGSTCSQCGARR